MGIVITKKQLGALKEYLNTGEDDTEIKIRNGERYGKKGILVSFPDYDQDGEYFIEK